MVGGSETHICPDGSTFQCSGGTLGCSDNSHMHCSSRFAVKVVGFIAAILVIATTVVVVIRWHSGDEKD